MILPCDQNNKKMKIFRSIVTVTVSLEKLD